MTDVTQPINVSFTVAFEDVEDGWVMARVLEMPGAISQGRTRAEARDNVRDALRELLLHAAADRDVTVSPHAHESLELTIAP